MGQQPSQPEQQQQQYQNSYEPKTPAQQAFNSTPSSQRINSPRVPPDEIGEDLRDLNGRLASFLHDIESLEKSRESLEKELNLERSLSAHQLKELREHAHREAQDMRAYVESLQRQLQDTRETAKKEMDLMQQRLDGAHRVHLEELVQLRDEYERRLKAELDAIRAQQDEVTNRAHARLINELETTKQRLTQLQDDYIRLKNQLKSDPETQEKLSRALRDNSRLLSELSRLEETSNQRNNLLDTQLREALGQLQRTKDALIDKDLSLSTLTDSYDAIMREVKTYRALLDREDTRGPLSSAKKRKLESSPVADVSPVPIQSFDGPSTPVGDQAQPVVKHTPYSQRKSTMRQTVESAQDFLLRDLVKISAVDAAHDFVTITNTANEAVNIGLWKISAEKRKTDYKFPPEFVLQPKASVTVYSGKDNEDREFEVGRELWWSSKSVWTKGENAILFNDKGTKVSHLNAV